MKRDGEDLPRYSVQEILRRRDQIHEELFVGLYYVTLTGADLPNLVDRLQLYLPRSGRDALFESLRQLVGQELLPDRLSRLAWQLAGNLPTLQAGRPVVDWAGQVAEEWVPVQILGVDPARNDRREIGFNLRLRILAGSPCSQHLFAFRRVRFLSTLSREIGFSAPWGKLPYRDARQLTSLRLFVRLLVPPNRFELKFEKLACPSGCLRWNKAILQVRSRVLPCPRGWLHDCHRCSIGYSECLAGTHKLTYVRRQCVVCGNESLFDPELPPGQCVLCHEKAAMRSTPR